MSDSKRTELATEVAAVLDEFTAAQRRQALTEARKQRITIVRNVSQACQVTYETVIDEGTDAQEIFDKLAPIDGAVDRLKAKADFSDFLNRILNDSQGLELDVHKLASQRTGFEEENVRASQGRRLEVGMTSQQTAQLNETRRTIRIAFEKIDELQKAAGEVRRILDGEDPFVVLQEQIRNRLEALRRARPAEAAD